MFEFSQDLGQLRSMRKPCMRIMRAARLTCLFAMSVGVMAQASVQSTNREEFRNAMMVCAGGLSVHIDADLEGSLFSLYEGGKTKGYATEVIVTELSKRLPDKDIYNRYVRCLLSILNRSTPNSGGLREDILKVVYMGEDEQTQIDFIEALLGPPSRTEKYIETAECGNVSYVISSTFAAKGVSVSTIHDQDTRDIRGIIVSGGSDLETSVKLDGYWNSYFRPNAVLGQTTLRNAVEESVLNGCDFETNDGVWNNRDPEFFCRFSGGSHADGWMNASITLRERGTVEKEEDLGAYEIYTTIMYFEGMGELAGVDENEANRRLAALGVQNVDQSMINEMLHRILRERLKDWKISEVEVFNDLIGGSMEQVALNDRLNKESINKKENDSSCQ